ncbi:MAG: TonB-dependent receptor, partial [Pseudomonadota bacterium]
QSETAELGFEYGTDDVTVRFNAYSTTFTDLIDFDPELFTNVNRTEVEFLGFSAHTDWQINDTVLLRGSINRQDNRTDEVPLRRRPDWFGDVQVFASLGNIEVSALLGYRGSTLDSSIATGLKALDAQWRLNVNADWQITSSTVLNLSIDNALASSLEESIGFINDRPQVVIGLQYLFDS